jgi:hypothetical protein
MGTSAVLEMPKGVCVTPSEIGTIGAFYEPTAASERKLIYSDQQLIRELVKVLDRQLLDLVDSRSPEEFEYARKRVWPRYVRALRALHDTASNLISDEVLAQISDSLLPSLAADLEKQEGALGSKLVEQSVFTLWMMPKIRTLAQEIVKAGDAPDRAADNLLIDEYQSTSLWAQLHLDAIFAALKFDRPVRESIREPICNGLRAAVNAYAIMKDALYLRHPIVDEGPLEALPWDAEDDELLASSIGDDAKPAERN